ncbi:Peptidase C19 ubiquitin carboxyl-terminal hydrolase 2 [Neofusicoccum parvum]|uniref:Peptidase C19 ubiquitin carboxyl-terminal hydrolase 2 n=1 Tax=Neofusicoccum parvum TaxID=310453 RepID=A0ACB5SCW2_9PEZI|nr:Peptidase C19 ubiquitin carboxyl-terminal hydrolase 2 [Neofusicoccum parvum]
MSQDLDQHDPESLAHPATNAPTTPTEQHEQPEDPVSRTPNTPSRVTLNLRPPQTPSHTRAAASPTADASATAYEAADLMDADSDSDSSETLRSSPSASSSKSKIHTPPADERTDSALSPSAASEPVVEIAVDGPDSMADSSDNMVDLNEEDEEEVVFQGDIFENFPYAKSYGRETALGGMLNLIAKPRHNNGTDGELTQLKEWLRICASHVQQGKIDARTAYLQEPIFWDEIAKMFHRITQRQIPYGEAFQLDPGHGEEDALRDLWSAYVTCVVQMLKVEIKAFEAGSHPFGNSRMISLHHMKILKELLKFRDDLPFWLLMNELLGNNAEDSRRTCSAIMSTFITELEEHKSLVTLVRVGIADRNLRLVAEESLGLISCLNAFAGQWRSSVGRNDRRWMAHLLSSLFNELDREIQVSLKAPIEICSELVATAGALLQNAAFMDPDTAIQLASYVYGNSEGLHSESLIPEVLFSSWLLKTLKQYILKGHMAHRIYGVEHMSSQFIHIWSTWSQKTYCPDILNHFALILLDDKIIDYIIGVDSHPQLISRSGNIVGFLAVTDHYGEAQTDAIWEAITKNQDPRMAEALIEMVQHTTLLMPLRELLYFCTKFRALPLSNFTPSFVELFRSVCINLQKRIRTDFSKWGEEPDRMNSLELCVHLVQKTYPIPGEDLAPFLQGLHRIAIQELALFSKPEFATAQDKIKIYEACAKDIAEKTPRAAPNAEIISTMLSTTPTDAIFLLKHLSLTEHVAEELCSFVMAEKEEKAQTSLIFPLRSRLELLFQLMKLSPTSITAQTEKVVWDHLVGCNAISTDLRDIAWHHLSAMASSQASSNAFLDLCAAELLPTLDPEFYSSGLFDFLRQLTDYQRRTSTEGEISADGVFQPPSIELFWRVILTAPLDTIERTTAEYLANLYLDARAFSQYIDDYPDVVQNTHTALVRRCVRQMVTAYSALKSPEKTIGPSEIEMKDADVHEDPRLFELQFQRTFLFLTVLLSLVKKRPDLQITSPRLRKPMVPTRLENTDGELRAVRFQSIGTESGPMQTVNVGDMQTLSWLVERLHEWTGFDEFRLIHRGAPLDVKASGDRTIRDLSLDQMPVLVKSIGDSAAASYGPGCSSTIEKEILKNYDIMFDFMDGGDDPLSEAAYNFLNQLPPHGKALAVTFGGRRMESIPEIAASAFSPGKLLKARISVSTLRKDFRNQMRSLLNVLILNERLIDSSLSGPHDELLALSVLETFTELLRERVDSEVSKSYFDNEKCLVDRLMSFLQASLTTTPNRNITFYCYLALLEAFNHSLGVWDAFKARTDLEELHFTLLVSHEGLYDLITTLCEDVAVYKEMVDLNLRLLGSSTHAKDEPYVLGSSRDLRSETGYVGLENPQALCYMNSMMTQLFMDIEFRKFVFEAQGGTEGGLLLAMQELFATMQSSYGRSCDMRPFAHCVRGTDKKPINVAIQMDTEEFFRLLMDQLESELSNPEDKQRLRNFYGGRSVNQIKSKDCQHVSETSESLFNLPLEVKGKETLEDSLKSYVEGESLEGENKYKCEPCGGRLVNAVKRTCLQTVPDNLIVHLKRFDFDPFTMTRSKINDYFRFQSRINMSPYKVEYLSDPDRPIDDDYFELVGILVHAGGVEQGHYWSYIRVRPDDHGSARWIKFNDDTVTEQDLSKVESECYGGNGRHTSAYMLLYQRASSIDKDGTSVLRAPQSFNPIAQMPKGLEDEIAERNERYIREHCMFDQAHAAFIRRMIPQMRMINKGVCTEDHTLEKSVIDMALEHAYEVIGRSQDVEELSKILNDLKRTVYPCTECTKLVLDWISNHERALADWLIYSHPVDGYSAVGFQIGCLVIDSLKELRARDSSRYGLDGNQHDLEQAFEDGRDGALHNILARAKTLVADLSFCPRGMEVSQRVWDVFFKFLVAITEFGMHEVALVLDYGFLQTVLEICHVDTVQEMGQRYPQLRQTLTRKSSKPSFVELTIFLARMISYIDLEADLVPNTVERIRSYADSENQKFPFTHMERALFYRWDKDNRCLTVLNRCLETWDMSSQRPFGPGDIIKSMLLVEPNAGSLRSIHTTIQEGVELLMPVVGAPFVSGAVYYCWVAPKPKDAMMMIRDIVNCMTVEKQLLGEAFLGFISNITNLHNDRWSRAYPDFFYTQIVDHAHMWAIRLLSFEDQDVQASALQIAKKLITNHVCTRPCAIKDFDTEAGYQARVHAVQDIVRQGHERMAYMQRELELPRNFVDCLFQLMYECHRYLRSLQSTSPETFNHSPEMDDLMRRCLSAEEMYKAWPESDEYDSAFSASEDLEYADNDVEAV